MDEMLSFKPEALQFIKDRFPNLRSVSQDAVLDFVKTKARSQ